MTSILGNHSQGTKKMTTSRPTMKRDVPREFTLYRKSKKPRLDGFQNHAPRVLEEVCRFAQDTMGTKHVKINPDLFQHIWVTGIDNPPIRVRLRLCHKKTKHASKGVSSTAYTLVEMVKSQATLKKKLYKSG